MIDRIAAWDKKAFDKRANDKKHKQSVIVDSLASLMGDLNVSPDEPHDRRVARNIPERSCKKAVKVTTWLKHSRINLALTVHGHTKLDARELDQLYAMDHVAMDEWVYKECDRARARIIKPSDVDAMPIYQFRERIQAFMRLSLLEIQSMKKESMVAYLRTIRPHLVKN